MGKTTTQPTYNHIPNLPEDLAWPRRQQKVGVEFEPSEVI